VEVLRRYSNRSELTRVVQNVLRRIDERDQTDEPELTITGGPAIGARRLTQAEREAIVEAFRQGVKIRLLAEGYGVTDGCIKRTLRRYDVGRRERY